MEPGADGPAGAVVLHSMRLVVRAAEAVRGMTWLEWLASVEDEEERCPICGVPPGAPHVERMHHEVDQERVTLEWERQKEQ